jgi:hypothetical protein
MEAMIEMLRSMGAGFAAGVMVTLVFWLAGFNFDARGQTLAGWFLSASAVSLFFAVVFYPEIRHRPAPGHDAFVAILLWFLPFWAAYFWFGGWEYPGRSPELIQAIFSVFGLALMCATIVWSGLFVIRFLARSSVSRDDPSR